jgi:hypothetical protein
VNTAPYYPPEYVTRGEAGNTMADGDADPSGALTTAALGPQAAPSREMVPLSGRSEMALELPTSTP